MRRSILLLVAVALCAMNVADAGHSCEASHALEMAAGAADGAPAADHCDQCMHGVLAAEPARSRGETVRMLLIPAPLALPTVPHVDPPLARLDRPPR